MVRGWAETKLHFASARGETEIILSVLQQPAS